MAPVLALRHGGLPQLPLRHQDRRTQPPDAGPRRHRQSVSSHRLIRRPRFPAFPSPTYKKKKVARNLVIFSTFREATHGMFRRITVRACACALHTCTMASVKVGFAPPNPPPHPGAARDASRNEKKIIIQRTEQRPYNFCYCVIRRRLSLLLLQPQEVCLHHKHSFQRGAAWRVCRVVAVKRL